MPIELRQVRAEDVPELGRICYEAFRAINAAHKNNSNGCVLISL